MTGATDSFGGYGLRVSPGIELRAARAADRVVTLAIALVLLAICAFSGYSLWDSWNVVEGGNQLTRPSAENGVTFADLRAQNPDVVGWLVLDGTNVDYPVVQGKDNYEYLDRDASGSYSASGSIFLDSECDSSFNDPYSVVMGHHMQGGGMFGDLDRYLDKDFFAQNQTGRIYLPDRTLELQVVAVLEADAYDRAIFGTPVTMPEGLSQVIARVGELATHVSDVQLTADDQVIALSTCSSTGATARTVLVCRVASVGAAVDAGSVG